MYKLVSRKLAGLSAPAFSSNDCRTCVGGKESASVQESCDPWWETSNEAVVGCTLNTHTLVLRGNQTKKCNFRPPGRLRAAQSSAFVLSLPHPPSTSSWEVPSSSFCPCQARCFLSEMKGRPLFVSTNKPPPQMFHRSHLIRRWDPSNQSSQLPLKSHHFPLITDLICV